MGKPNFDGPKAKLIDGVTPTYIDASEARPKRIKIVLADFYREFFLKFDPLEELFPGKEREHLTDEETKALASYVESTKEKLHRSIRWNAGKGSRIRTTHGSMSPIDKAIFKLIIQLSGMDEGQKRPSRIDSFNKLYFITHVQPKLKTMMELPGVDVNDRSRRMTLTHQIRNAAVKNLTVVENAHVDVDYKRSLATYDAEEKMRDERMNEFDRAEQAANREHLGPLLDALLAGFDKFFGYSTTIMMGGRDLNDRVRAVSMHHGQTAAGNTFAESVEDFSHNFMAPFGQFVGRVHQPLKLNKTEDEPASIPGADNNDPGAMKVDSGSGIETKITGVQAAVGADSPAAPISHFVQPTAVTPQVSAKAIAAAFPQAVFTPEASQILHGSADASLHTGYNFADPSLFENFDMYQNNGNGAGMHRSSSFNNGAGLGMTGFMPDARYWPVVDGTGIGNQFGMANGAGGFDADHNLGMLAGAAEMLAPLASASFTSTSTAPSFRTIRGPLGTVSNNLIPTPTPAATVPAKRKHVVDPVQPHLIQAEPRVRHKSAKMAETESRKAVAKGAKGSGKGAGKGKKAVQGSRKAKAKA